MLAGVYGDHGKSGTSIKRRSEFQRMLRDCEDGKIDIVMTKSISRFARNLRDCLTTIDHLKQLDIPVLFEKEGINTMDNKSELLLNILAIIAEEESIRHRARTCAGRMNGEMRQATPSTKRPTGTGGTKRPTAGTSTRAKPDVCGLRSSPLGRGVCYQEIIEGLNEMEREEETGLVWDNYRLTKLLKHEAYIGDVLTNKSYRPSRNRQVPNRGERDQYYIESHHEPIIDRVTYDKVQELVKRKLLWTVRKRFTQEERELLNSARNGSAQEQRKE